MPISTGDGHRDLIRYYQTGDPKDWLNLAAIGFRITALSILRRVYRGLSGCSWAKGTSQSFVSITDQQINQLMTKIADNAQYFENRAPWAINIRSSA